VTARVGVVSLAVAALAAHGAFASPAGAQSDSTALSLGVTSRAIWREATLADGTALESGASLALGRVAPALRFTQLELRGSTALARRARNEAGDQYSAALHYELPLAGAPHPSSLVLMATGYLNPSVDRVVAGAAKHSEELGALAFTELGLERLGVRTLRLQLEAARDVGRRDATWLRAEASATAGTTIDRVTTRHTLVATLRVAGGASDFAERAAGDPRPAFDLDGVDVGLELADRLSGPTWSDAVTTTLIVATALRASRRGPDVGWVALQESVLLF